jgi:cytochrome P450
VFGHALRLIRRPLDFLREVQAYGDIVLIRLGRTRAYFLSRPEHLHAMLVTNAADFDKGVHYDKARVVVGNGLPASSGAFHRRQRKLIRPAFQKARLCGYFDTMLTCTRSRVESWSTQPDIDLNAEMHALAVTIAAKALASTDVADSVIAEIESLVSILAEGVGRRVVDPTGLLEKLPIPSNRRFDRARARLRAMFEELILEYRRREADCPDVLSILVAARDEDNEGMSDTQLRDEVVSILLAGLETTAQTLKWTCHALAEHPEVQQRVRVEIEEVLAGRTVQFEDLERLSYTRRVLLEVLRLYPPLYFLSRRPTVDVEIGDLLIPAGSTVLFSPYAVHHDPTLYPDPDRFDPDRWLSRPPSELPPVSYLPFGAGIRSCIGEQFAFIEMLTILSYVLPRWTLRSAPSVDVRPKATFVLTPSTSGVILSPTSGVIA